MPWYIHSAVRLVAGALTLLAGGRLADGAESPSSPAARPAPAAPEKPATPGTAVEVASSDLSSLNRLLPVGKTARKVTVPTVDVDGRLTSVVTMNAITRVDDEYFDLEKVVLTSYDEPDENAPEAAPSTTVITLTRARYHAPSRVLVSDAPVTIRKPTLYLRGDSLHYDSAAGRAVIKGRSEAVITDAAAPGPSGNEEAEAPEEETTTREEGASSSSTQTPK